MQKNHRTGLGLQPWCWACSEPCVQKETEFSQESASLRWYGVLPAPKGGFWDSRLESLLLLLFLILCVYLFTFGCAGSALLCTLFSSCGEWGLLSSCHVQASHCDGFSRGGAQTPGHVSFTSCGSWALRTGSLLWPRALFARWHVGSSWIRDWSVSPALTGGLSTTEPWGEDQGFVPEAFPHNLRELMVNKLQTFIPLWFGFVRTEKTVPLQTVIKLVGSLGGFSQAPRQSGLQLQEGLWTCLSWISKNWQHQFASSFVLGQVSSALISLLLVGQAVRMSEVSFLKEWSTLSTSPPLTLLCSLAADFSPITPLKMLLKRSLVTSMSPNPETKHSHPTWPQECSCLFAVLHFLTQLLSLTSVALLGFLQLLCHLFFAGFSSFSTWHLTVGFSQHLDPKPISLFTLCSSTGWPHLFWGFLLTPDVASFRVFCLYFSSLEL